MTFVALPVLPDRGFGPYEALNPYQLWLMTIVIAGVSFGGYVAVKVAGDRYGALIAGISGGLVSSTATTLDLARKAKAGFGNPRHLLAGALAASATMFVRVGVIVALFGPQLLPRLAAPLAAAAVVLVAAALFLAAPWAHVEEEPGNGGAKLTNPFELRWVLGFGALLAGVLVLSKAATQMFGGEGGIVLAAVAGTADVDAITLSMTQLAGASALQSELAILVAVVANTLSKSVFRSLAEGAALRSFISRRILVAIAAGMAMFFGQGPPA